jgi:hypothetical protein
VTGLVDHMPAETVAVQGSDLVRARQAGYDDSGELEDLGESVTATAVSPDPLSHERLRQFREESDLAGYEPGDVECWLGPLDQGFVARGSFDADRVGRSGGAEDGSLELGGGLLAHSEDGEPDQLLASREQPATVRGLVEAFDRHGAISFSGSTDGDDPTQPWVGIALARADDWELLVVLSLPDGAAAVAAEADVREVLQDESLRVFSDRGN